MTDDGITPENYLQMTEVWNRRRPYGSVDQWPAHKAKARRQRAQRRALGRAPRHQMVFR